VPTTGRLARRAGIDKRISPHSLRHAAITAALDAGCSLRDVQDFARHADPRQTRRYDRARGALDRNPTYIVATYLAGATGARWTHHGCRDKHAAAVIVVGGTMSNSGAEPSGLPVMRVCGRRP
jgi:hypothetical protein